MPSSPIDGNEGEYVDDFILPGNAEENDYCEAFCNNCASPSNSNSLLLQHIFNLSVWKDLESKDLCSETVALRYRRLGPPDRRWLRDALIQKQYGFPPEG